MANKYIEFEVRPDNIDSLIADLTAYRNKLDNIPDEVNERINDLNVIRTEYRRIRQANRLIDEINEYRVITDSNVDEVQTRLNRLSNELQYINQDNYPSVADTLTEVNNELSDIKKQSAVSEELQTILNKLADR